MSFPGTKTPTKSNRKAQYQLPMRRGKGNIMEYYFTPELEAEFRRRFPKTTNRRMMELFGIGFSCMQRFKREMGLEKNMTVIRRKQTRQTKAICEKNGYYDSLRGRGPSKAAIEGYQRYLHSDRYKHPMQIMKERSPQKYRRLMAKRSEARKKLEKEERLQVRLGLSQRTGLHRPQKAYNRTEIYIRYIMKRADYILGDISTSQGERFIIYYDSITPRKPNLEARATRHGFEVKELRD